MTLYASEIRDMTTDEIIAKIKAAKQEQFNLRFQLASGQLEDVTRLKTVRRDVARLKTILRERQLAAELATAEEE